MVQPISSDRWADVTDDWRAVFEATYSSAASPTQERIWRAVFGDAYPDGVDPYSFVSRMELTSWDYHRQPVGRPPQVPDHRPLAEGAGFDVVAYETTEDWRERQRQIGQRLLEAAEDLAAEQGLGVAEIRSSILEMNATLE